mgnify:CR=1 FL=1
MKFYIKKKEQKGKKERKKERKKGKKRKKRERKKERQHAHMSTNKALFYFIFYIFIVDLFFLVYHPGGVGRCWVAIPGDRVFAAAYDALEYGLELGIQCHDVVLELLHHVVPLKQHCHGLGERTEREETGQEKGKEKDK